MYAPAPFYSDCPELAAKLVDDIVMGTLVATDPLQSASPLPFKVRSREGQLVLESHLDIRNPLCEILQQQNRGKIIFWGPDAYLSPALYSRQPRVPTWLFVSAHLAGTVNFVSAEETISIVSALSNNKEASRNAWKSENAQEYINKIATGIKGFTFHVEKIDIQLRLGQQNSQEVFAGLIDKMNNDNLNDYSEILKAINEYL